MRLMLLLTIFVCTASITYAGDGFGPRFDSQTPSAFDDPSPQALAQALSLGNPDLNDMALDLQNIEPAAGEEETLIQPPLENIDNKNPQGQTEFQPKKEKSSDSLLSPSTPTLDLPTLDL